MPLSGVPLQQITEAHLQGLIDNSVREGRRIDYKESVGRNDEAKREFLADVSSFANAAGGDLLIGVAESSGVASGLAGIPSSQVDKEILRLESVILSGLDPRIPGISTHPVPVSNGERAVLVIRIPRSWAAPHMVTLSGLSRFFSRNSAGKYRLDVDEIRSAFVGSESARTGLRSFRLERLGRIAADDGPIALMPNPKIVLHVVPLTAVDPSVQYDVATLATNYSSQFFRPLNASAYSHRINFDGALSYAVIQSEAYSYTQIFRNGALEGVDAFLLRRKVEYPPNQPAVDDLIPSVSFEEDLIEGLGRYLALLQEIGAPPPYVVALSLLDVRGMRMAVSPGYIDHPTPIDRDDLILPEVLVQEPSSPPHTILKPVFDAVWNACGWPHSPYYTEEGEWQRPGR